MKIPFTRIFLLACLTLFFSAVSAQQYSSLKWKRQVRRRVPLYEPVLKNGKEARQTYNLQHVFYRLVSEVETGKVPVYAYDYQSKLTLLSKPVLDSTVDEFFDIDWDYVTQTKIKRKQAMTVGNLSCHDSMISYVDIIEEWTYDVANGKTKAQIIALAPLWNRFHTSGDYAGKRAFFWVRWRDMEPIVSKNITNGGSGLLDAIWNDYLEEPTIIDSLCSTTERNNDVWFSSCWRDVKIVQDTPGNDGYRHLTDAYDSSAGQIVYYAARGGRLKVYHGLTTSTQQAMTADELAELIHLPDDTLVTDAVTEFEEYKIIHREKMLDDIHEYLVHEHWQFDVKSGQIRSRIIKVASVLQLYSDEGLPSRKEILFTSQYEKARDFWKEYYQHIDRTMEWQIWHDRFSEPRRRSDAP